MAWIETDSSGRGEGGEVWEKTNGLLGAFVVSIREILNIFLRVCMQVCESSRCLTRSLSLCWCEALISYIYSVYVKLIGRCLMFNCCLTVQSSQCSQCYDLSFGLSWLFCPVFICLILVVPCFFLLSFIPFSFVDLFSLVSFVFLSTYSFLLFFLLFVVSFS